MDVVEQPLEIKKEVKKRKKYRKRGEPKEVKPKKLKNKDLKGHLDLYILEINDINDIGKIQSTFDNVKILGQLLVLFNLEHMEYCLEEITNSRYDFRRLLINLYNRDKNEFGYNGKKEYISWGVNRGVGKNKGGWVFNLPEDIKVPTGFFNFSTREELIFNLIKTHSNEDALIETNSPQIFEIIKKLRDNVSLDTTSSSYTIESVSPLTISTLEDKHDDYLNKIILSDCFDYLNHIKNESVDLVITDPPYNVSVQNSVGAYGLDRTGMFFGEWDGQFDTEKWVHHIAPKVKEGGQVIIFNSFRNISHVIKVLKAYGYEIIDIPFWLKTNPIPHLREITYVHSMEHAVWAVRTNGKPLSQLNVTFNGKPYIKKTKQKSDYNDGVITASSHAKQNERFHTTQKPLWLFNKLIQNHSNVGDLVLDTFMGSGTTAVSCISLKRDYMGCELEQEYYDNSMIRLNKVKRKSKYIFKQN